LFSLRQLVRSLLETIVTNAGLTAINLEFVLCRSMPADWRAKKIRLKT
jgi:hypothetical protein